MKKVFFSLFIEIYRFSRSVRPSVRGLIELEPYCTIFQNKLNWTDWILYSKYTYREERENCNSMVIWFSCCRFCCCISIFMVPIVVSTLLTTEHLVLNIGFYSISTSIYLRTDTSASSTRTNNTATSISSSSLFLHPTTKNQQNHQLQTDSSFFKNKYRKNILGILKRIFLYLHRYICTLK